MAHHPTAIADGIPPYAVALAQRARATRLVIYAGAGLSLAEPAGLPTGAQVALKIHARLKAAFPVLAGIDPGDLVGVSDAVASLPGGEEALRMTAVDVAEFGTAEPTYAHQVLALLLLEGVLDVFTTNWDNCIERSGQPERVHAVVTGHDLLNVSGRRVLKIHGCCTQPNSLLLTTAHLDTPPSWVTDETRARLSDAVVVFVGIGDVAGYVKRRLEEALAQIGNVTNVRLVSPGIVDNWDGSQWSHLVPGLAAEHRIAASADEFLEKVGAAYVHLTLAATAESLADEADIAAAFEVAVAALSSHDARTVLLWARRCGVVAESGESVLATEAMAEAIAALGKLVGSGARITPDSVVEANGQWFEVLASVGPTSATRLKREARNRLERHVSRGNPPPTFVVGGGIGWTTGPAVLPADILGESNPTDVIDGPASSEPTIRRAREVLAA